MGAVKPKVKDEFAEKEKKPKEEEKIKITPAVSPEKPKEEPEDEPEEPPKSKDKVRDEFAEREKKEKEVEKIIIKPSVEIKMAAAPEPVISRRKKKEPEPEEAGSLFDDLPQVKPKVKDEFTEREKKAKEEEKIIIKPAILPKKPESESESEEEEEVKPEPKKKLSKADLKPAVQIKIAAAPEPVIAR